MNDWAPQAAVVKLDAVRVNTHVWRLPLSQVRVDLLLFLVAGLFSASAITYLIFYLSRHVDSWTARQMSLLWLTGLAAVIVFLVATANVPKHREFITTRCDPAREAGCRATGAPQITASGDTACCYPGVIRFALESKTPAGEAAKITFIMLAVGTMFGLIMLTSAWTRRRPTS